MFDFKYNTFSLIIHENEIGKKQLVKLGNLTVAPCHTLRV